MASTHQSLPSQGWEHRLPWGTLSHSSINNTKCSVSSAAHSPTPHPHSSYWGWRKLGKHRFQNKRVEQIETSLLPASQALQQGKGREKALLILQEPSFKDLISLPPRVLYSIKTKGVGFKKLVLLDAFC